jgi:uncharacterized membrane protein
VTDAATSASSAAPTWGERILGGAAYLCWLLPPLWLLSPLLIYWWKGRTSRFVALHAVQAVLLFYALFVFSFAQLLAWPLVMWSGLVRTKMQGDVLMWIMAAVMTGVFAWGFLWMPLDPLRGRPAGLPVLARWAERILSSPLGEHGAATGSSAGPAYTAQTPEDRLLAGAAYLSLSCLLPFPFTALVIYFWKRKISRFVGFHALQAFLLHVLLIPSALILLFGGLAAGVVVGEMGRIWRNLGTVIVMGGSLAAVASPFVIVWRGFAAMLGPPDALPLLGRLARWTGGAKAGRR